jgi:glycosyltransferase involved in cell wall biosynthesis
MTKSLSIKTTDIFPIKKYKKKNAFIPDGAEYFKKISGKTKLNKNFEIIEFLSKKKKCIGKEISFTNKNNQKVKYIIVGSGEDEEKLRTMVKNYKLEKDIDFFGYRSDIQNIMSQMDLIVLIDNLPILHILKLHLFYFYPINAL